MRKGWFVIPGVQDGDRTLAQQVKGLEGIDFHGQTVLELACAEGLMSKWMIERGAKSVDGIDIIAENTKEAWRQCTGLPCSFRVLDLNDLWRLFDLPQYDIVMALAVLHKLKRPAFAAAQFAALAKKTFVVRLPPANAPLVIDPRSENKPQDIDKRIWECGFTGVAVTRGSFKEWTGIYSRR